MSQDLVSLARTLHALLRSLPALRQHASPDIVGRQLALIRKVRAHHDRLASGGGGPHRR